MNNTKNAEDFLRGYGVLDGRGNMDGVFVPLSVAMIAIEQVLKGKLEYNDPSWIVRTKNDGP